MQHTHPHYAALRLLARLSLTTAIVVPGLALAQADGGLTQTACGFLNNVQNVLNAVSVVVVTIAVIFSGYQIAFAHKRISDVAPVFIGALLIGAASQIAKLFLSKSSDGGCSSTWGFNGLQLEQVASVLQSLVSLNA